MQIQRRDGIRNVTRYQYAGVCGYDDPVYEPYTTTEAYTKDVVVFDNDAERRAFHKDLIAMKGAASTIAERILRKFREEELSKREREVQQHQADMDAYNALSFFKRVFVEWKPEAPFYFDSVEEVVLARSRKSGQYGVARWFAGIPNEYTDWIEEVSATDYKNAQQFMRSNRNPNATS